MTVTKEAPVAGETTVHSGRSWTANVLKARESGIAGALIVTV